MPCSIKEVRLGFSITIWYSISWSKCKDEWESWWDIL